MWLFLYFQVCIKFILVANEVITLLKDDEITCVSTEDTLNSPMYIDKFYQPHTLTRIAKNIENLNFTDWKSTSDTKNFEPVTDERWTGFKTERLHKKFKSVSTLSMCTNGTLNLKLASNYQKNYTWVNETIENLNNFSPCQWIHLRITLKRTSFNTVVTFHPLLLGHVGTISDYKTTIDFDPRWIFFNSVYKMHSYDFWESTAISSEQSHIDVRQPHKRISMYTSVDKGCFLNVTFVSGNKTVTNVVNGTNEEGNLKTWEKLEMETTNAGENGTLFFFRGRYDSGTTGYWAVDDIQIYDNVPVSVARMTLPKNSSEYDGLVCRNLYQWNSAANTPNFCDIPSFGKNCSITCSELLGLPFSSCEKYRIIRGNESHCAWGYHGPECTETCELNHYGMDCEKECEIGCAICSATVGCTKCNSADLATNCSQKLPVVTERPILISLKENVMKVFFNLTYGKDEINPDSYIIQYKNGNESFINYTEPRNYVTSDEVTINLANDTTCRIRVILLYRNFSVQDNVPELTVHKTSLKAELIAHDKVSLQWNNLGEKNIYNYTLKYHCVGNLCSKEYGIIFTNETKVQIPLLKPFETCIFNLSVEEKQFFGQVTIPSVNYTKEIQKEELPTNITLSKHSINVEFENCEHFLSPLTYSISYKCTSSWCRNQTKTVEYNFKQYNRSISKTVDDLISFTSYEIKVIANRQGQTPITKNYSCSTPPGEPFGAENLSVYGVNKDTLFVRWTEPYPPTGEVELYTVSLKNKTDNIAYTLVINTTAEVCDIWKTFVCVNISGFTNLAAFELTVRAKNHNVSQWGEVASINVTTQNGTSTPELVWINSLETTPLKITLEWKHPIFTYGVIQSFQINITDGKTQKTISKNITEYQEKYHQRISVESNNKYKISIWATNNSHAGGEKAHVVVWVFGSIPYFSNGWFIKFSNQSKKSYLIVPKPNKEYENFNVTLSKDGRVICSGEICEIGAAINEPETYVLNYSNNSIPINSVEKKRKNQPNTSSTPEGRMPNSTTPKENISFVSTVSAVISAMALIFSLAGYLSYAYKQRKFPFQKHENQEDVVFNQPQDEEILLKGNKSTSIEIDNMESYISESLKINLDNIIQEFQIIPTRASWNCNSGQLLQNVHKNRYKSILPYDNTRIILRDNDGGDYINASYINSYDSPNAFIATQAPLESTIHHFWSMVCQEKIKTIVMLMKEEENDGTRCAHYWPSNSSYFRYGRFLIQNVSMKVTPNYIHRKFQVKFENKISLVQHYQYIAWSDNDVPLNVRSFNTFIQEMMVFSRNSSIIVHCNTGCGRTGIFILCYIAIQMGRKEQRVDFYRILKELREKRPNMLSNVHQYIFAHYIIKEYFFGQYEKVQ